MNDPVVGIDLGTSNTVCAHASATGTVQVLADGGGFRIHPSVVSFHPTGGVIVGAPAKQRKVIDPKNTIFSAKRLIGRTWSSPEVQTARQRMPYQIKEGANQLPLIVTRGGEFAIPEISAIVLDHVKHVATSALGAEVSRAVVTVPASFNDAQRSATATAGAIAGLTIVRVLNEPTAAALAYGHSRDLREIIAVYDFGGGTFDITILKLADQVYEVLGTSGNSFLGGDDLDERIVDRMVEKFLADNRVDLRTNEVAMMRLRAVAEQVKIELSRRTRAMVRVDEIAYGPRGKALDLQIEIRRDELIAAVADIIDRTFPVCEEALNYAQLSIEQIDDVVLVGGTTKIPYVRDQVTKFFAKAPRTDVNPEDAVAVGAALQARALERMLVRKSTSRQPLVAFDSSEGTFGGDSVGAETVTYAGSNAAATMPELPMSQIDDDLLELAESTRESPPSREPQPESFGTGGTRAQAEQRPGARSLVRGEHSDILADRTPPPPSPSPSAHVIGRMTKPSTSPAGARSVPPVPPRSTPQAKTLVAEPPSRDSTTVVDPPLTPGQKHKTLLGVPSAASTLPGLGGRQRDELDFADIALESRGGADVPLSPASTARGFAPPAAAPSTPAHVPAAPVAAAAATAPTLMRPAPAFVPPTTYPVTARAPAPVVMDVTPRGLGVGTVAGFCEELIPRNSRLPAETRKLFTTSRDAQESVRIVVCQGESRRLDSNVVIGDLVLSNLPPRARGETSIEVTFALDASGILHVRARDPETGREQSASLDLVGTMQPNDVDAAREKLQTLRR